MQIETGPLALTACGVSTIFGETRATTTAKLAEGRPAYRRLRSFLDDTYAPQLAAFAGEPEAGAQALLRTRRLTCAALDDLLSSAPGAFDARGATVAILLPAVAPAEGLSEEAISALTAEILADVNARSGHTALQVTVHATGPTGLAEALHDHSRSLSQGLPLLVLGAESFACRTRLAARAAEGRLFSAKRPYSAVPGEAGVALLLDPAPQLAPLAHITGTAHEFEPIGALEDGHSTYAAQSEAAYQALESSGRDAVVDHICTDWTNGRYRASELAHCYLRLGGRIAPECEYRHLALTFGDTGVVMLALAVVQALAQPGRHLFLAGCDRTKARVAMTLTVAGA